MGFTSAKVLATKIVYLYNLSHSQLSQQDHYDFGMRAIKAVLLMAGEIKRSHVKDPNLSDEQSEVELFPSPYGNIVFVFRKVLCYKH